MYCKHCGAKLDDDAVFCENCGTPVSNKSKDDIEEKAPEAETDEPQINADTKEDIDKESAVNTEVNSNIEVQPGQMEQPVIASSKESQKNSTKGISAKVIAAIAAVVIIAIVLIIIILKPFGNKSTASNIYQETNFNNGGSLAFDDNRLYLISSDKPDGDTALYSTDYNGVNKQMILDEPDVVRIRVIDDKLCYESGETDNYEIGMIDKDGSNKTTIISIDDISYHYDVYKDTLYYLVGEELYSCSLNGGNIKALLDDVSTFTLCGGVIYYVNSDDIISSYNVKDGKSTQICKASGADQLSVDDGILYYACDAGLCCISLDGNGTTTTVINDDALSYYVFCEDSIYYLHKLTEDELVAFARYYADNYDNDFMSTGLIMFDTGWLYQAPISGGIGQPADNGTLMFRLYAYPQGLYYRFSLFTKELTPLEFTN